MSGVVGALVEWMRVRGRSLEYFSFAVRRATGIFLAAYLLAHMVDISTILLGRGVYDALLDVFHGPIGLAFDVILVFSLSLHGALGIYSAVVEAGLCLKYRRALLAAAWIGGLAGAALIVWVILNVW